MNKFIIEKQQLAKKVALKFRFELILELVLSNFYLWLKLLYLTDKNVNK